MNEQNVITWDEAERILSDGKPEVVKSGLPQQVRPSDPENSTNVDDCIQRLLADDPRLVEINLNNMKVRLIYPIRGMEAEFTQISENADSANPKIN